MKMVLIYAHRDSAFLKKSKLLTYLGALVEEEGFEFWWDKEMNSPLWDEEIRTKLQEADIIVCLVSQSFIRSKYIQKVESIIASKRLNKEGVLVVPIIYQAYTGWGKFAWLKKCHHFPTDGKPLERKRFRNEIFLEIIEYIRAWYHGRVKPFKNKKAIYTLRRSLESSLSKEQMRILVKDSCEHARQMVPNDNLRVKIVQRAKGILKTKGAGSVLNKSDLEKIDKDVLAGNTRKPDAVKVRWVLRCAELHPQGRVQKQK